MLIVNYLPTFSGHAIFLQRVIPLIKEKGYRVEVLTGDFGKYPHHDCIDAVEIHRVRFDPQEREGGLRFTLRVLAFLFQHRRDFDILHAHGNMYHYGLLIMACKVLRKKIIMHMVLMGADDPESIKSQFNKLKTARFKFFSLIDRFIYLSRPIGESCARAGLPSNKLRLVPQGTDTQRFLPRE